MDQQNEFKVLDGKTQVKCLDLIQQAYHYKLNKKGVNEVIKSINKGQTEIVILAADTTPIDILMSLPSICLDKNIPFCFISSGANLGRASGIKRPTVAASIIKKDGSQINSQIIEFKDIIEQFYS